MKHLFVPYELALLAKEKGFSEPCLAYYNNRKEFKHIQNRSFEEISDCININGINKEFYNISTFTPFYQQLVDWFRNKHSIQIFIEDEHDDFCATMQGKGIIKCCYAVEYYNVFDLALTEAFKLI